MTPEAVLAALDSAIEDITSVTAGRGAERQLETAISTIDEARNALIAGFRSDITSIHKHAEAVAEEKYEEFRTSLLKATENESNRLLGMIANLRDDIKKLQDDQAHERQASYAEGARHGYERGYNDGWNDREQNKPIRV